MTLLPNSNARRKIIDQLGSTNLAHYLRLKKEWKTSMAALIYRASELGTITSSQSANLWRQMAMRGYRKVEPNELDREPTYRSFMLFDYAIDAKKHQHLSLVSYLNYLTYMKMTLKNYIILT